MNKLEQQHLNELYNHEYEEIPNSALYKFKYEEAAVKSAEITADVAIKFGKWLHIHSKEANNTVAPCRYYKNRLLNIDELFNEFINNHYGNK